MALDPAATSAADQLGETMKVYTDVAITQYKHAHMMTGNSELAVVIGAQTHQYFMDTLIYDRETKSDDD